jgi:ribosomal protein S18 acetylase RimI-like enzyme
MQSAASLTPAVCTVRPYTLDDVDQLLRIQRECFPPPFPPELWWQREQIASHIRHVPAGALCAVDAQGELLGSATANRLTIADGHEQHTWADAADHGWLRNADPAGDTLYGVDVAVRPCARGQGVARALYQARFALVRRLGLRRFLAGSRISGYHRHAAAMSPERYADEVIAGRLTDPVITPQLRAGLTPVTVVRDYLPDDESCGHALLMAWNNPDWTPRT